MGDRIVVMKDGHIQQIDTPLNLYNNPANVFVGGFIGSPSMNFIEGELVHSSGLKFKELNTDNVLDVPSAKIESLRPFVGKSIIAGVRPESAKLDPGDASAERSLFQATIDVVEPMGNEIIIYTDTGKHRFVVRISPQSIPGPGQVLNLEIDSEKLHFFDVETESAIS